MTLNEGILHFWPFAKYAVAFQDALHLHSRQLRPQTGDLHLLRRDPRLAADLFVQLAFRFAFTQLESVCSTTPRLRDVSAMLWPDSTRRTASCLNSNVYLPRLPFLICHSNT